ncbi:DEAD/DEAH box helicase [Pseudodesulfovibrio thermohalotolerans]|uniref:DEAD/DEAH box helicase n=1 Tax=Pseudodesulfovibrio thermohalotolerans TaxID=2880651 RepID=UPI0022B9E34D|nr:DEAD/DEAH box helicase [Pseudodesulfovibrio thermohalotolerans]WFS63385.1 DEAD/DEAH box helicase [Pseudodesulfovibrio thermohalotolerans]
MTFTTFPFDQRIVAGIKSCGYESPTPIQKQAIPQVLQGYDVLGLAQTGTGKTAAFALPILQRLLDSKSTQGIPRVLILAPTRELALQIQDNFASLGKRTGIRCSAVIGGVGMAPQIKAFRSSQIIVACPGRLVRLLSNGSVRLNAIDTLVLDEADRMLDLGFMPDIKRITAQLPKQRQNLLFSATMPKDIRKFADRILVTPKTVKIANTEPVATVEHSFHKTQNNRKSDILESLLAKSAHESVLIFTRTKHKAKNLSRELTNNGHNSTFLQGNMSQGQRQRALVGFREGKFTIMVATDIAARGIDCDRITHVINYDMPDTVETYTHRIGRTGRAGRSGNAVSFVTNEDKLQIRAIERVMNISFERQIDRDAAPRNTMNDTMRGSRSVPQETKNSRGRKHRSRRAKRPAA